MTEHDLIWLFPILFMVHDFEEIIGLCGWIRSNGEDLAQRFPRLMRTMLPHLERITPSSFALGVAEEFIIISAVTIHAAITHDYRLWLGLFIAYTLHLVMHMVQAFILRRYIPALITSILCLPISILILLPFLSLYPWETVAILSLIGVVITAVNLYGVHKLMDRYIRWSK